MFNFIEDGESYIDFGNPNYMTNYPNVDPATASNWFVFNKQRVYYNEGQLLGHGGWYVKLDGETPPTYLGEWSDGSANVKFREKKGDPILQFEGVINEIPSRFTYPASEQSLNGENYSAAVSNQGADLLTTKIWWNK